MVNRRTNGYFSLEFACPSDSNKDELITYRRPWVATMKTLKFGRNPGQGRGKALTQLKGRQAAAQDIIEVRQVLGTSVDDPTMLIEYIHRLQDTFGEISLPHLAALAHMLKLSQAEVYEVATFYHSFKVTQPTNKEASNIVVRVCESLVCELAGADTLAENLAHQFPDNIMIERVACLGRCERAPVAGIGAHYIAPADVESVSAALEPNDDDTEIEPQNLFSSYHDSGGYGLLRDCLDGNRTRAEIVDALEASQLNGLGGAGFPTARKWRFVMAEAGPRYLVVNGDESEPGTFKDRHYMERDPHRFIEGMLISAWAIEATATYLYIRNEYPGVRTLLEREIKLAETAGLVTCPVIFRRGAGAYICGEESALLESLEGKRGLPRHKPPFPAQIGLFGRPTLINNLETLYWVPNAVQAGAAWHPHPTKRHPNGLRSYSVSGRVKDSGVKLAPAGITARELIDEYCGGMADGHEFRAYLPGGASGGILPATMADLPLDFGTLEEYGALIGSAAVIVLSQQDDIKSVVKNLLHFFAHESCGQCTPCRVGTEKAVTLMNTNDWDLDLLTDIADVMADGSICGLGQAAANPIRTAIKYFPGEIA
jgi:formate dehydrogenase